MKSLFLKATGAVIILAGFAVVRADTLYQNTATPSDYVLNFNNGDAIGEEVWLGTGALAEYLTNFQFQYYSPNPGGFASVEADVQFYENNGTPTNGYNSPGTLFYDSGLFSVPNPWSVFNPSGPTNSATLNFALSDLQSGTMPLDPNLAMPSNFTFVVTFSGLSGGDQVGLPVFDPPQVGANAGDYWYDVSGNWELLTNSVGPIAFGAEFFGSPQPTPEPSVLCLGALGAALTVMARRRQRRG